MVSVQLVYNGHIFLLSVIHTGSPFGPTGPAGPVSPLMPCRHRTAHIILSYEVCDDK